jgi:AraC family transcriptional regulator, transcriptional activator of the genes for pyochelin and ferripyochelin receptors
MVLTLSEATYLTLRYQSAQQYDPEDLTDVLYVCPPAWGNGYERWVELPDIDLMILAGEFTQDLQVDCSHNPDEEEIELGFNLWGERYNGRRLASSDRSRNHSFIEWIGVETPPQSGLRTVRQPGPILKVDLHLHSPEFLCRFLPESQSGSLSSLQQQLGITADIYRQEEKLTVPMHQLIQQILRCPFQGTVKRLYLESKCLELMALKIHQTITTEPLAKAYQPLTAADRDRIHDAKAILLHDIAHPPSLLALAKQVGLNDHKLKVGFRQEFGTTVFGYLHQHRMVKAQSLLATTHLNIQDIARIVGYASRSRFATAFRKQFGVNPKVYRDG